MIRGYINQAGRLQSGEDAPGGLEAAVWIDLFNPSQDEKQAVQARLGIEIPSREDMEEIEISSRLYHEDSGAFMTAILPAQTDTDAPMMAPVTFILASNRVITVRYHEPKAFQTFPLRAGKSNLGCVDAETTLVALLETIIDRLADILERAGHEIDGVSQSIFQRRNSRPIASRDFQALLETIGRKGDLTSNIRESLLTMERLIAYLGQAAAQHKSNEEVRTRIATMARDTGSLNDHVDFLSQKVTFLLDATLGMISIEQSAIIKIFTVAAVAFLPPTLIASIYGMNFARMPELSWDFGYPFALGLMLASAVLPFLYFKRRGWL
jgi:magnesium transporter